MDRRVAPRAWTPHTALCSDATELWYTPRAVPSPLPLGSNRLLTPKETPTTRREARREHEQIHVG